MRMIDIIDKKKKKQTLSKQEIEYFISGFVNKEIPDYQASALLMAIVINEMEPQELLDFTQAVIDSGHQVDLSSIKGITVDKHSTGGVGDKVSIVLVPVLASLGLKVAKMSGKGLGHTGGTIDKLESIEGFKTELDHHEFIDQVNDIGLAIIGQSKDIAYADKLLYALRDVTATIDSYSLIAASIMSKKIASGAQYILLDVKYGQGAFMHTQGEAEILAQRMITIGEAFGRNVKVVLSNMNQPLGTHVGNLLEVQECLMILQGKGSLEVNQLITLQAGVLLHQTKMCETIEEGQAMALNTLLDGSAYTKFNEMVAHQNGSLEFLASIDQQFDEVTKVQIVSHMEGYIKDIDAYQIGMACVNLKAGRLTKDQEIDYLSGIVLHKKVNDYVKQGDVLAEMFYREMLVPVTEKTILDAYQISSDANSVVFDTRII